MIGIWEAPDVRMELCTFFRVMQENSKLDLCQLESI
jgi:hypothetical protein